MVPAMLKIAQKINAPEMIFLCRRINIHVVIITRLLKFLLSMILGGGGWVALFCVAIVKLNSFANHRGMFQV